MTFTTWGQTATHSTTVSASPAPTTTTCKVAAVGTLRVGMAIYVDVSGTPEQTFITAIGGDNLTFSPALSAAPDVGGDLVSYHQPLSNSKLNNGAVWKATSIADLTATDTTNMNDGTLAYVPGYGIHRLQSSEWILDIVAGGSDSEESVSNIQMEIQNIQESIIKIPEAPKMWTIKVYQASLSVPATSFGSYTFVLAEQGVTFNKPDFVHIQSPQEQATLIQCASYFKTQNTVVARFYNPTAGAVTIDGGEWIINIWRNPNA